MKLEEAMGDLCLSVDEIFMLTRIVQEARLEINKGLVISYIDDVDNRWRTISKDKIEALMDKFKKMDLHLRAVLKDVGEKVKV